MTGSLGDPATLKLVDQEDQEDEDPLGLVYEVYCPKLLLRKMLWRPPPRPDCPGMIGLPQER